MEKLEGKLSSIRRKAESDAAGFKGGGVSGATVLQPFTLSQPRPKPQPVEDPPPRPMRWGDYLFFCY
jgi:hypothetical protein